MPLQAIPPIVMASITFAFGGFVLYLFVRRGRREDLTFAVTCLSMVAYDVCAAAAYGCRSVADAVVWQRAQVVILSLVAIALIRFVADYTGEVKPPWRWAFSGYFALSALVIVVERVGLTWRPDQPSVKVVHLPWGLSAVYVEASAGPLMQLQCLMGLLAFLHLFMASLRAYRTGQARRARPLLLALCFFCLTLINDVCVGNGYYSFVYLLEYGYLGMVLLLVFSLTAELVEAGAVKAQRGLLEEQLRQAAKLEAVGRLAGGVAHDLNNQLTPILGYSELALGRAQVGGELRRYFEQIRDAADQARELTRQLLALGRKQVLKLTVVDLNQVVGESKLMLERVIPENIELRVSLDPELGSVRGDPTQLRQILFNLALNARDAMPDGGVLEVATYQRTVTTGHPEPGREQLRRPGRVRLGRGHGRVHPNPDLRAVLQHQGFAAKLRAWPGQRPRHRQATRGTGAGRERPRRRLAVRSLPASRGRSAPGRRARAANTSAGRSPWHRAGGRGRPVGSAAGLECPRATPDSPCSWPTRLSVPRDWSPNTDPGSASWSPTW